MILPMILFEVLGQNPPNQLNMWQLYHFKSLP